MNKWISTTEIRGIVSIKEDKYYRYYDEHSVEFREFTLEDENGDVHKIKVRMSKKEVKMTPPKTPMTIIEPIKSIIHVGYAFMFIFFGWMWKP